MEGALAGQCSGVLVQQHNLVVPAALGLAFWWRFPQNRRDPMLSALLPFQNETISIAS